MATVTSSQIQLDAIETCHFHVEVIAGIPIEKPLPKRTHQQVMQRIYDLLRESFADAFEVYQELNYICGDDIRIPDLCVCASDATFQDDDLASPALLCVEVMSPGQTLGQLFTKCEAYHRAGTPICWVVWPLKHQVWLYPASGELASVDNYLAVETKNGELRIDVNRIFAGIQISG